METEPDLGRPPPVLVGAVVVGMRHEDDGTTWLVLRPPKHGSVVGTVHVEITLDRPPWFSYAVLDRKAGTLSHYRGSNGDPTKDEMFFVHPIDPT